MVSRLLALFVSCLLIALIHIPDAQAQQRHPGDLGVGLGSTTIASGVSVKQIAGPTALQLTAGCWRDCDGISASLDFLGSMPPLTTHPFLLVAWNFGFGGALGLADSNIAAAGSFILGLEVIFQELPFDLVLEWRPSVLVVPDVDLDLITFGGHIRFYP